MLVRVLIAEMIFSEYTFSAMNVMETVKGVFLFYIKSTINRHITDDAWREAQLDKS